MAKPAAVDSFNPKQHVDSLRLRMCLQAVWEIDALARALPTLVPGSDDDSSQHLVARGVAARMLRLSSCLMSGLDDEGVSTEEIAQIVTLEGISQG